MSLEVYLAYIVACVVLTIIPGPMVTLVLANSLTRGMRAGLLNVAGAQLALVLMLGVLVIGLSSIVETMGWWFEWLRFLGAAYLVWLGWKMLTSAPPTEGAAPPPPRGGFFLQGFLVMISNPKTLLFFGAFIPQFVNSSRDAGFQIVLLGATAMVVAIVSDGAYAVLGGRFGALVSRRRMRIVSRVGGASLIGGGVWLAFTRAR